MSRMGDILPAGKYYMNSAYDTIFKGITVDGTAPVPGVGVMTFKGKVPTFADLPTSPTVGDVYDVTSPVGMNYVWTGTEWDALGNKDSLAYNNV